MGLSRDLWGPQHCTALEGDAFIFQLPPATPLNEQLQNLSIPQSFFTSLFFTNDLRTTEVALDPLLTVVAVIFEQHWRTHFIFYVLCQPFDVPDVVSVMIVIISIITSPVYSTQIRGDGFMRSFIAQTGKQKPCIHLPTSLTSGWGRRLTLSSVYQKGLKCPVEVSDSPTALFTSYCLHGSSGKHTKPAQVTLRVKIMLFSILQLSFCGIILAKLICVWNFISVQPATASVNLGEPVKGSIVWILRWVR